MPTFNWKHPPTLAAFGAALRKSREARTLTLDQLAALTGISKPYLSNIETGSAPGPASEEKLRKLARALHLPPAKVTAAADWLRTPPSVRRALLAAEAKSLPKEKHQDTATTNDTDAPRRADGTINLDALMGEDNAKPKTQNASPPTPSARANGPSLAPAPTDNHIAATFPLRNIPIINRVAAGTAREFTDLSYPAGIADGYVPAPDLPEAPIAAAFAVRITGDSMMPDYREGDLIIVGPPPPGPARDGIDCVVRLGDADNYATTFKRVFYDRDDNGEEIAIRLVPLNPAHPERRLPLSDVTGIYPLIYRLVAPPHITRS